MKTSDGFEILKRRYIGDDRRLQKEFEKERLNAEVARLIYNARKRAGLTQRQLAHLVGTKQSVISRLEDADYGGHSLKMLKTIAAALGQRLEISFTNGEVDLRPHTAASKEQQDLKKLIDSAPAREMHKRGWLPRWQTPGELRDCLVAFLGPAPKAGARFRLSRASDAQESALTCWLTKLEIEAERMPAERFIATRLKAEMPELVGLSAHGSGPSSAVEWLQARGMRCVFVRHLGRTYLDGAAMLLDDGSPVIGLTLRRDRLDNFWFTLLHEIAHVLLHKRVLQSSAIVDEKIEEASDNKLEKQADRFAAEAWISREEWAAFRRTVRGYPSNDQIGRFAARHRVSPALVAGRLRHELKRYTHYRRFLGEGTVRTMVGEHFHIF